MIAQNITLINAHKQIYGSINLPLSKSLSNRILIIHALMDWDTARLQLSEADDTALLQHLLQAIRANENSREEEDPLELNCKNAGTVFRFLTAFLSTCKRKYLLTGTDRMLQRPIQPLVEALTEIGAQISYLQNENFPPLLIQGGYLEEEILSIDASQSSQFVSAVLLILPTINRKSEIILHGEISSWPYISMTLDLMRAYGISYEVKGNILKIWGKYRQPLKPFSMEADWSSASYWYELLAIAGTGELFLNGLRFSTLQGDSRLANIFESLGVSSMEQDNGILIRASGSVIYNQNIDFKDIPDLAPAVIVACAALGVMGRFTGLESLNSKESRRMDVLCDNLQKLGFDLRDNGFNEYVLINSCDIAKGSYDFSAIQLDSHDDHRMLMAFAPLTLIGGKLQISHPQSVNKSYPLFWEEFSKVVNIY